MKQLDLKTFVSRMPPSTFNRLVAELRSATEIRLGNEVLGELVSPQRKADLAAKLSARVADDFSLPDSLLERLNVPTVDEPQGVSEAERIMAEISTALEVRMPDSLLSLDHALLFVSAQSSDAHWEMCDDHFNLPRLILKAIERATGSIPLFRDRLAYHRLIQNGTAKLPGFKWDTLSCAYIWSNPCNNMTGPAITIE